MSLQSLPTTRRLALASASLASAFAITTAVSQTLPLGLDHSDPAATFTSQSELLDRTNYPAGAWTYTTGDTHDGVDAVTSLLPNRSLGKLDATVQGPATVTFWWKTSGGDTLGLDTLQFSSRNDFAFRNGNADWQQHTTKIDTGTQPLRWIFERNSSLPAANARAWLDEMVVTPIPNSPLLQEAVENFSYTLHSTDWVSAPLNGAANSTVAKSGPLQPNQTSTMVFEVEGPATLKFHWGITADENDESRLSVSVNSSVVSTITGPRALSELSLDLGPGTHAMKFSFQRGYNASPENSGPTEGFVDQLIVDTFGASPTLADAVDRPDGAYSNSWQRQTLVSRDQSDAAMVTAPVLEVARRIYIKLPDQPGLLSFWYKLDADPQSGYLFMNLDNERIIEKTGVQDWTRVEFNLGSGSNRVLEGLFVRYPTGQTQTNPNANSPNTRAYLDNVTFTPGATNYQPDLTIGPLGKKRIGTNIYNNTASRQISTIRTRLDRPYGEFSIRIQNLSGTDSDTIRLRGTGSRSHFKIYFVVKKGKQKLNYLSAFITGKFKTALLGPKGSENHEIWVERKRTSIGSRSHGIRVIGTSETDSRKRDTIKTSLLIDRR